MHCFPVLYARCQGDVLDREDAMDALEMTLLFDYYGDLLTERQRMCVDLRHNQDLSLAEIAEELNVSRQGVYDNLSRAEALLRNMEEKTGCVRRDLFYRKTVQDILNAVSDLEQIEYSGVQDAVSRIKAAVRNFEE